MSKGTLVDFHGMWILFGVQILYKVTSGTIQWPKVKERQTIQWPKVKERQTIQYPKVKERQTIQYPKVKERQTIPLYCLSFFYF
jgi:hypothetical protein